MVLTLTGQAGASTRVQAQELFPKDQREIIMTIHTSPQITGA